MKQSHVMALGQWFNSAPDQVVITGGDTDISRLDILHRVALIQSQLVTDKVESCVLHTSDTTLFVATLLACACTGVTLILPANNTEDFVKTLEADCFIGDWPNAQAIDFTNLKSAMPQHLGTGFKVDIFTSGSTGKPKRIKRDFHQLLTEVNTLQATFEDLGLSQTGVVFAATVSHQHIYGLLFKILWPLLSQQIIWFQTIPFEESLDDLTQNHEHVLLISSPAFLKRIHDSFSQQRQLLHVFSSGGLLSDQLQKQAEKKLSANITQVYGSSETGGIAHRKSNQMWQTFKSVQTEIKSGVLWIKSPFCYTNEWHCTEDLVEVREHGFMLKGRNDRIVKIEEKRISLQRVETLLLKNKYIDDVAVLGLENGRQYLGALIVLSSEGRQQLKQIGGLKFKQSIKRNLTAQLDAVAIPRKITFTQEALENTQGKRSVAELKRRIHQ